ELTLNKVQLTEAGKTLDGTTIAGGDNFTGLKFPSEIPAGTADLTMDYTGKIRSPQPAGIFVSQDNGNRYLLTQFETTDARDAFPCFDEPTYKVPWQLTLDVPVGDAAISNTPAEKETTTGNVKTVTFKETKPLPSYLVAFGVGPFEFVDAGKAGKNQIPVRIVTPKGRASEGQYAAEVTAPILTRLETYFGIPYPYEQADQVAIPIPSGFAMENPGMVTYSGSLILAKAASDTIRRQRTYAEVAAHELAHQWFGDLVTTNWWNDTWLNEAFATWMEEKLIAQWKPEWNTRASDVLQHLGAQREDSLPSTRRIRQQIESMGDIDNAFDAITYEKGANVIGMFENWIGPDKFQQGVQSYLNAHAFKTATTADFLAALSEASGKDVRSTFSTFVDQPGIPVVSVALKCDKNVAPRLTLGQSRFSLLPSKTPDPQLWSIPVCVRYGSGDEGKSQCALLTQRSANVALEGTSCPAWVEANDKGVGYYRVDYRDNLLSALTAGNFEQRLNPAERVSLIGNTGAASQANLLPYSEALKLAARFHDDPVPPVLLAALDLAISVHGVSLERVGAEDLIPSNALNEYQHYLANTFGPRARELGWLAKEGEPDNNKLIRPGLLFVASTLGGDETLARQAQELATKWLTGDRSIDPNVAGYILQTAAFYGNVPLAEKFLAVYKASKDVQDRSRLIRAMGVFRDPAALQLGLGAWASGQVPVSEGIIFIGAGRYSESTRKTPFEFVKSHYSEIEKLLPPLGRSSLPLVGNSLCDEQSKNDYQSFFEPRIAAIPGMRRTFAQVVESIDGCIVSKRSEAPAIAAFLKQE
ncbi:MAG: family peptidase, partial [Bryobacterales bacterium]|nr:family peptidase [Bryobacterales bacterium]